MSIGEEISSFRKRGLRISINHPIRRVRPLIKHRADEGAVLTTLVKAINDAAILAQTNFHLQRKTTQNAEGGEGEGALSKERYRSKNKSFDKNLFFIFETIPFFLICSNIDENKSEFFEFVSENGACK